MYVTCRNIPHRLGIVLVHIYLVYLKLDRISGQIFSFFTLDRTESTGTVPAAFNIHSVTRASTTMRTMWTAGPERVLYTGC